MRMKHDHELYRCIAFGVIPGEAVVTTNDRAYYDRLMEIGGEMLCHPGLFTTQESDDPDYLNQSVPYVVQIQLDILAQIQYVPTGKYVAYETQLYR